MMRVLVDCGHTGGSPGFDPGAVGPAGTKEADVVLKVSKFLRDYLSLHDVESILSRENDDASIDELWTRVKMVEDNNCDILVSIHCNAAENQQAHGYERFTWTNDPPSAALADYIYESYSAFFPDMAGRGLKQANFGVLKGDFPSVLIELAFITNIVEEYFLNDEAMQMRMARAIGEGILAWKEMSS